MTFYQPCLYHKEGGGRGGEAQRKKKEIWHRPKVKKAQGTEKDLTMSSGHATAFFSRRITKSLLV